VVKDTQGLWCQNGRTWRGNSSVLWTFPAKQLCQILTLHTHLSVRSCAHPLTPPPLTLWPRLHSPTTTAVSHRLDEIVYLCKMQNSMFLFLPQPFMIW